jgi:5'-3' exonuclease
MAIRFLLVDALTMGRRVYAAHPGDEGPEKAEGAKTSCAKSLRRALRECEPTHAVVVFEGREPSWRHLLFRDYKIDHKPMPEALRVALPEYREAFASLGVTSFEVPKVEADDVIGTLATKIADAGGQAIILSTDKIFLQLLSDRIFVRDHFKKTYLDHAYVVKKFGVDSKRFVDFLALAGDGTNSIRGVPGVGPKTAARLIGDFGSLDAMLAAAGAAENGAVAAAGAAKKRTGAAADALKTGREVSADGRDAGASEQPPELAPKRRHKLVDHIDDARLAQSLVRLQTDLDLGLNLKALRYRDS